jgi:hypothetical protein
MARDLDRWFTISIVHIIIRTVAARRLVAMNRPFNQHRSCCFCSDRSLSSLKFQYFALQRNQTVRMSRQKMRNLNSEARRAIRVIMASVVSERQCLHRDLLERGGASSTCNDDDAFSCRTDLTTVKASSVVWRVTVRSVRRIGFLFFRSPKAVETNDNDFFLFTLSQLLLLLLEGKLAHPSVTFSHSLDIFRISIENTKRRVRGEDRSSSSAMVWYLCATSR